MTQMIFRADRPKEKQAKDLNRLNIENTPIAVKIRKDVEPH